MQHSIVIGGTRGLGRVVTRLLAQRGDVVTVIGRREPPPEDLGQPNVHFHVADLLTPNAASGVIDAAIEARGAPSYLVFCQRYRGKDDDWAGELRVSLTATREIIESVTPKFSADGDKGIVVVSSVFGHAVGEGQPASYHVGKAGMNQLARFYAVNLGRRGVRVNTVTPFTFLKDESKSFYMTNQNVHGVYQEIIPLGRMGSSEDSANAIAFLCSPVAGFITGQELTIDGGLSLVWPETLARKLRGV